MNVVFAGMTAENINRVFVHSHPYWEILYYVSGSGFLQIGDQKFPFSPGHIVCQPPHVPHSELCDQYFKNIYIHVANFKSPSDEFFVLKDNNDLDLQNVFMFLYREFHLKKANWTHTVDALLAVIYSYLSDSIKETHKNSYVNELENIIINNITNPYFKIDEGQKAVPLSNFYMKRLFKKETGQSPIEYLTYKRIEYAKMLLESRCQTNMTIKEIASQSGYTDPYYFSRVFKKITGISPSHWNGRGYELFSF